MGDQVVNEGYVSRFRVDDFPFRPSHVVDIAMSQVEYKTFLLVTISIRPDAEQSPREFRLIHDDRSGEKLATAMALVATVKDAFIHNKKVRVYGEVTEHTTPPMAGSQVVHYRKLQSVEVIGF